MAALRKYITEFIGTFFLVGTIGWAVTPGGAEKLAPLAIGCALMAMVYMGGHVSGAHYNPMVSLAVLVRRKMSIVDFVAYIISQIIGATVAALAVWYLRDEPFGVHLGVPSPAIPYGSHEIHALLAEFIFSFALALVVVNVATAPKTAGNSYYGIAIGFIVTAGAWCVGSISGAAFNPSVATGPAIVEAFHRGPAVAFRDLWIYWVAPLAGGLAAGLVCNFQVAGQSSEA